MYFTDAGIEELDERRGDEQVTMAWLAERMRDFVDLNPEFETAIDRLAKWLARTDRDFAPRLHRSRQREGRGDDVAVNAIHLDFSKTRYILVTDEGVAVSPC